MTVVLRMLIGAVAAALVLGPSAAATATATAAPPASIASATAATGATGARGTAASVDHVGLSEAARRLRAGGYVLMMRHAQTEPGVGDPPGFRLDDCSTQRQLSAAGRMQATRAGEAMRTAGIVVAEVLSSVWCRCQETAWLAFGAYRTWASLNSFFNDASPRDHYTREVVALASRQKGVNLMLVTHQVNITAVFDVFPVPAEVIAGRWQDGQLVAAFRFVP